VAAAQGTAAFFAGSGLAREPAVVRERAEPAREMLPSLASSPGRVQELYTLTSTKSGTVVYAS